MTRYILLKDLPDAKAGRTYLLWEDKYVPETLETDRHEPNSFFQDQVESNADFFEPILEKMWTDADMIAFIRLFSREHSAGYKTASALLDDFKARK